MELFDILTFDTTKISDVLDIDEVYGNVLTLTTPVREIGLYEIDLSGTFRFLSANKSMYFRWRVDGSGWTEFVSEPKDASDIIPMYYAYPWSALDSRSHVIEVEVRKEDAASNQLDLLYLDITLKRVGV